MASPRSFALIPESESMRFSLAQLAELGRIRFAADSPALRYELPELEVRVAVAEVPPAFAQQSP